MKKENKRGLVLGGGGSRGSYSVGVLATLTEQKHSYDVITGISIGAMVGAIAVMNKKVDTPQWIASMTQDRVAKGLFNFPDRHDVYTGKLESFEDFISVYQKDGPNIDPLRSSFEELFDFEAFRSSPIEYACLAANLSSNTEAVFTKSEMKTEEQAVQCMLASAAYFPAFSFVEIDGQYFADGGYLNTRLGDIAMDLGADDLTVVALDDPDIQLSYAKENTSLLIRPIVRLGYFLEFDPKQLTDQIEQGRLEALKYMNLAPGYIYTFYEEDVLALKTLSRLTVEILKKNNIQLSDEMLMQGITALLGYRPAPLHNRYMKNYQAGLVLECLALIAGLSYYHRYHLIPFIKEILNRLRNYEIDFSQLDTSSTLKMDRIGAKDLMSFFHAGLTVYNGRLPDEFQFVINKFRPVYYLALAWHILDKFSTVLNIL